MLGKLLFTHIRRQRSRPQFATTVLTLKVAKKQSEMRLTIRSLDPEIGPAIS
jgi:hypothetical protein